MIAIVVAATDTNVIGDSGHSGMLWHLPDDFKRFKELTMGSPIIMGRKTMQAIGRLLPGRTNIVVTRQDTVPVEGAVRAGSLPGAIAVAKSEGTENIFIIGGGEIYHQALPLADTIYMTRVHAHIPGDTTFPDISSDWQETERMEHATDEKHAYPFEFVTYKRKP